MKAHLADATHDVLDYGSYPTASALGGFPATRVLYDVAVFSPHKSLVKWRLAAIADSRCVTCISLRCQVQKGWRS